MMPDRRPWFRWKALAPLALFFAFVAVLWGLFADSVLRRSLQEAATQVLGTQVDIGWVHIHERRAGVEIGELAVADPFDPTRNLIEIDRIRLVLDPRPLLEKKIVITDLAFERIELFAAREKPATPVEGGLAARTSAMVDQWRDRFGEPFLGMSAVDSIRTLVLDPSQLASVAAAERLMRQTDSLGVLAADGLAALGLDSLVAEGVALAERVARADPGRLGLSGTRALVGDARSVVNRLEAAEEALARAETAAMVGVRMLTDGIEDLERARTADYRRAESMLGLPDLDLPSVGGALFGQVSLSYVRRAVYWAELARRYLPPGLRPRVVPGPKRLRAAGTDVRFPKEDHVPSFHLVRGEASEVGGDTAGFRHTLTVTNISSEPALVGEPAIVAFSRLTAGTETLGLDAVMDHTGLTARDSLDFRWVGVALPAFTLPGMPITAQPGAGRVRLAASVAGDRFFASWTLEAPEVTWLVDSASADPAAAVLRRVLSGLTGLHIVAEVAGSFDAIDEFSVRSNVDDALARQMKALAGELLATGQERARAEVDRVSRPYLESATSRAADESVTIRQAVREWQARLAEVRSRLEEEVRKKTGVLGGLIGM